MQKAICKNYNRMWCAGSWHARGYGFGHDPSRCSALSSRFSASGNFCCADSTSATLPLTWFRRRSALHPPETVRLVLGNDRNGAGGRVPASRAERPLSVGTRDLRGPLSVSTALTGPASETLTEIGPWRRGGRATRSHFFAGLREAGVPEE